MKFSYQKGTLQQSKAEAVVVFIGHDDAEFKASLAPLRKIFGKRIDSIIAFEEFKGKKDELLLVYTESKLRSPRLILAGIGERKSRSLEQFRRAASSSAKKARSANAKTVAFVLPSSVALSEATATSADLAHAITEGACLGAYRYDKYKTEKKGKKAQLTEITVLDSAGTDERAIKKAITESKIICEAVHVARDLENAPGNDLYPETLAEAARESAKKHGFRAEIWDKRKIEQA